MKRIFTFGLMLTAVFALTNCTEELVDTTVPTDQVVEEQVTGVPFQIQATLGVDTKTAGDFVGGKLKTKWKENDKINVLFAEVQNGAVGELKYAGLFTVTDTEHGIFEGFLPNEGIEDSKTYNWYFVYDASGATFATDKTTATITIGSVEQKQSTTTGNNTDTDVEHIGAASNCPMWGRALNLSGSIYPRVQMTHLAALYEVTIRNETKANSISGATAGDILVKDIGMSVSSTGTWISKDGKQQKALVGNFTLDVLNGTIGQDLNNKNYSVKLTITENPLSSISSESGKNEKKYYFVTAPVDIQTNRTTDSRYYELISNPSTVKTADEYNKLSDKQKELYRAVTKRQDTFTFTVNGSARTVSAKAEYNQNTQSGNLYKFTLPVHEMTHPLSTNGDELYSKSRKGIGYTTGIIWKEEHEDESYKKCQILDLSNATKIDAIINGTSFEEVYQFGTNSNAGSISITGWAKDMVLAMPLGFYVSRFDNEPVAMTIKSINVWVPDYEDGDYTKLKTRTKIADLTLFKTLGWLFKLFGLTVDSNGIPRKTLEKFVDPNSITFTNISSNGYYSLLEKSVTVMNEEYAHKSITSSLVNSFLSKFNINNYEASFDGLYAIVTAEMNSDGSLEYFDSPYNDEKLNRPLNASEMEAAAFSTANAIYEKMLNKIATVLGADYASYADTMLGMFFSNATDVLYKLRDAKFQVVIQTYPYADKYTEGNDLTTGFKPVLMWGMNYSGIKTDYTDGETLP